jgi:hypothetical protein
MARNVEDIFRRVYELADTLPTEARLRLLRLAQELQDDEEDPRPVFPETLAEWKRRETEPTSTWEEVSRRVFSPEAIALSDKMLAEWDARR